jgi:F0F1-type ATP synthase membrane subunit b/b'
MAKSADTKKAATKETRESIVETIRKTRETVTEKIKGYNEKYLADTIEKGKQTVKDYNEKYLSKHIEKGKDYFEGPYKKMTDALSDIREKGRGIEKDARKKFDEIVAESKKIINKIPMVETIEKKVTENLRRVPAMVNMPSKGEIEKLTLAMESLSANIETLKKENIL